MSDESLIPDFSGDDFANDKEIQQSRAAIMAYKQMMDSALGMITDEFRMQEASHIN